MAAAAAAWRSILSAHFKAGRSAAAKENKQFQATCAGQLRPLRPDQTAAGADQIRPLLSMCRYAACTTPELFCVLPASV